MGIGLALGLVGAATGLIGASKGASAQKSAANTQAAATRYATDEQLRLARENRDMAIPLYDSANSVARGAAIYSRDQANNQAYDAERIANDAYGTANANAWALYAPYAETGFEALNKLRSGNFEESPAYRFRLNEGLDAIEASAAARGGLFSGATGQALQTRGQQEASQEYDNIFRRQFGLANMGLGANAAIQGSMDNLAAARSGAAADRAGAVSRNMGNWADILGRSAFGRADGISGVGARYASTAGNALNNYAQGISSAAANRGNATAAQWAGIGNAVGGGIENYLAYDMMKNLTAT